MTNDRPDGINDVFRAIADHTLGIVLKKFGRTPNQVTVGGAIICIISAIVWSQQTTHHSLFWVGLGLFLFGSLSDMADGSLARCAPDRKTPFGPLLDSFTDRVVELSMYAAVAWVLMKQGHLLLALGCFTAQGGAFLVTYARAKAENTLADGQPIKGNVGRWGDRSKRMLVFGVLVTAGYWIGYEWLVLVGNVQAWSAAGYRVLYIRRQLEDPEKAASSNGRLKGVLADVFGVTMIVVLGFALEAYLTGSPW